MGSSCGIGGKCIVVKSLRQPQTRPSRPVAHVSSAELVHGQAAASYAELAGERAERKLRKWRAMCQFKLKQRECVGAVPACGENSTEHSPKDLSADLVPEEICLQQYALMNPGKFGERLTMGPPAEYRWMAWKTALQIANLRVSGLYQQLCDRREECSALSTILQDRDRTFADQAFSRPGLENVLVAYSLYDPEVGYCQGMNYLAGFLLIVSGSKEEDCFWTLVALMKRKVPGDRLEVDGLRGLYCENFPLLRIMLGLFESVLAAENPGLKEHLRQIGLPNEIWLQQWVSSLFLYSFPVGCCVRFWDAILVHGVSFILPISCAVVDSVCPALVQGGMDRCYATLKSLGKEKESALRSSDEIVLAAEKIGVDWKLLNTERAERQTKLESESATITIKLKGRAEDTSESPVRTPMGSTHPTIDEETVSTFSSKRQSICGEEGRFRLPPIKRSSKFVFEFKEEKTVSTPTSSFSQLPPLGNGYRRRLRRRNRKCSNRNSVQCSPTPRREAGEFRPAGETPRVQQRMRRSSIGCAGRVLCIQN